MTRDPSNSTSVQSAATNASSGGGRSPLIIIFITVFIDLVGFGVIIPASPYIAIEFGATATQLGLLMSVYSFAQFLFSPFWGGLSDRIGRRPTILLTLLGSAASYFLFAFSNSLWLLFIARGLAGVFGGNLSTAHAYIGDVTKPEERSKGMGLIGAAFGLGFIFGPLLGGALGLLGQRLGSAPPFGLSFAALGVGVLCLGNFVFAWYALKESLPAEVRSQKSKQGSFSSRFFGRFREIGRQMRRPIAGRLMVVYFLSGLAMAQMEPMLIPFVADNFGWGLMQTTYGFAYIGFIMVLTQGYFIRKWMPRFGEPKVLAMGLILFAISLFGIAVSYSLVILTISVTLLALGNGMMRPPNLGIISLKTPADEQGISMGVTNSLASLGRIIGPAVGGVMYQQWGSRSPFALAGVVAICALILILTSYKELPASGKKS